MVGADNGDFKEWEAILAGKGMDNMADVLERGWDDLEKRDYYEVASYGKVDFDPDIDVFNLKFFNDAYVVDLKNRKVLQNMPDGPPGSTIQVYSFLSTLIIHYLASVKNIEISGELVTFREVPGGGDIYYPAFQNNAIRPIIDRFGETPRQIIKAGEALGGKAVRRGDAAVEIPVFPKIPVTAIVWAGDEEIQPNANILFDETVKEQIHIEDVAVIGGVVAGKLVKYQD